LNDVLKLQIRIDRMEERGKEMEAIIRSVLRQDGDIGYLSRTNGKEQVHSKYILKLTFLTGRMEKRRQEMEAMIRNVQHQKGEFRKERQRDTAIT
jgi:proteasome assembly chaperone (PAC2) family protein